MLWHPFFAFVTGLLNGLFGSLPPWTFDFGQGCHDGTGCTGAGLSVGGDGGALHYAMQFFQVLDRFIPLHDAVFPALAVQFSILVGLNLIKGVKWGLSLIPTISSAG